MSISKYLNFLEFFYTWLKYVDSMKKAQMIQFIGTKGVCSCKANLVSLL